MPEPGSGIGAVLLAAGSSSRMGRPKQLLQSNGKTLFENAANLALAASCKPVIAVTGNWYKGVPTLPNVTILHNPHAAEGIASSIETGVNAVAKFKNVSGVLFLLSDQPLITIAHLKDLMQQFTSAGNDKIVATRYSDIDGVPAIFPRRMFPELSDLKGDEGARKIINLHKEDTISISFPDAAVDIDTEEAYQRLIKCGDLP